VDPVAAHKVDEDLASEGIRPFDPIVGIHAGGAPCHRWPMASFAQVMKGVRQTYGFRLIVIGGPDERRRFSSCRMFRRSISSIGPVVILSRS